MHVVSMANIYTSEKKYVFVVTLLSKK